MAPTFIGEDTLNIWESSHLPKENGLRLLSKHSSTLWYLKYGLAWHQFLGWITFCERDWYMYQISWFRLCFSFNKHQSFSKQKQPWQVFKALWLLPFIASSIVFVCCTQDYVPTAENLNGPALFQMGLWCFRKKLSLDIQTAIWMPQFADNYGGFLHWWIGVHPMSTFQSLCPFHALRQILSWPSQIHCSYSDSACLESVLHCVQMYLLLYDSELIVFVWVSSGCRFVMMWVLTLNTLSCTVWLMTGGLP